MSEVHIWHAQLDSDRWPTADRLPVEERERAANLRRRPARERWLAARWALRGVLGRYLEEAPAEVELRMGPRGKPMLATPSASLRFNLSHSGERAVVAIGWDREIGVDVERVAPRRDLLTLARRALGPAEARAIAQAPAEDRLAAFHVAWTRREAVAKCLGVGLGAPLPDDATAAAATIDAGAGYAAAVAVAARGLPPRRHFVIEPGLLATP